MNQASLVELSACAQRHRRIHAAVTPVEEDKKPLADLNLRILAAMIERLTGKKIDIILPEDALPAEGEIPVAPKTAPANSTATQISPE